MNALHFNEFEPYSEMIADADLRMRVLGFERPQYSIVQAVVADLGMQWASEGSGQLTEGVTDSNALGLFMHVDPRPMRVNGMVVDPDAIVIFPPGSEFRNTCTHANSWFSIRVPVAALGDVDGRDAPNLIDTVSVVRPRNDWARKLREIVPKYFNALYDTPSLAESTLANERLQAEVMAIARQVCVRSTVFPVESHETSAKAFLRHEEFATRAAELMEDSLESARSVAEIAQLLGVSERTLLNAFQSRFGASPRRFAQAMRLNRARALLRRPTYPQILVKDVAAQCGFWDFGRFAAKYHQLFGEYPSETVAKATS